MTATDSTAAEQAQRLARIEQLLGRCLLKLQCCEHLLKQLVVQSSLAGPIAQRETLAAERAASFSMVTLGQLINEFLATGVIDEAGAPAAPPAVESTAGPHASFRHALAMPAHQIDSHQRALRELLALRNDLVHQFVRRFALRSLEGCTAAQAHLEQCLVCIESHLQTIREWARTSVESIKIIDRFLQSPEFDQLLRQELERAEPALEWAPGDATGALQAASRRMSRNGWTPLAEAVSWAVSLDPQLRPGTSGCGTWQQLVHASSHFELEVRREQGRGKARWYRPRKRS